MSSLTSVAKPLIGLINFLLNPSGSRLEIPSSIESHTKGLSQFARLRSVYQMTQAKMIPVIAPTVIA